MVIDVTTCLVPCFLLNVLTVPKRFTGIDGQAYTNKEKQITHASLPKAPDVYK